MRVHAALSREDLEAILAVTRALALPFELRGMLHAVTDAACRVLRAERASVWLHDAATDELVLSVSRDLGEVRVPLGAGLVGACARSRQPILVPDCYADPRFDPAVDRRSGFRTRSALTLPLVDHAGTLVGTMQVLNRADGPFEPEDLPLGEALAAQCALALSRVRMTAAAIEGERLRRELEVARTVQLASLPPATPEVPGYELHAIFRPADVTGGDTYDLAPVDGGLVLVIGDAAGHGLAPALMVTQMQAMLRMALRLGASLETAFRQVNDQLAATYTDGRFVTAFVGLLDPRAHLVRYLSGGQAPILHVQAAEACCRRHGATSFPLGAMPLATLRPAQTIELAPGDALVLVTDGVFEASDCAGRAYGVERVEQVLCAHVGGSASAMGGAVLDDLVSHLSGRPSEDDVTLVVVRRREEGRVPKGEAASRSAG
jgi:phosphoserine phosphatase